CDAVEVLPENTVIHRLTGDGDKKLLVAPLWSADKKRVLNEMNREFRRRA
ncbi:MAG: TIGR01212 family radical SAM protein, partial [Paraprevotella sp.]|nr:TIGR01212 family radical SAM protein [Paraprevotella sp.]